MSTIEQLIRSNMHRPVRKLYIKRRNEDGTFEADWLRIDNYKVNEAGRVKTWGSVSMSIDDYSGKIGAFNVSNLTLTLRNDDGFFNVETDDRSIWFGYLNRKYTKVKIDVGYLDVNGSEVGVETIFEGYVDKATISDQQTSKLQVLSYQTVLKKYEVSDLIMSGGKTINAVIDLIMNQAKITKFIPFIASDVAVNSTITDTSTLKGTYWNILKDLCFKANSVPLVYGSSFQTVDRTVTGSPVWTFFGKGSANSDIFKINSYDDEGADRVRVFWIADSGESAKSVDATLLAKYLDDPETINLDEIDVGDRAAMLNALLAEWENPKPVMEFTTRFLINQVKPLDIVAIDIEGNVVPSNTFVWGAWVWGDGSVWGKNTGAINVGVGSSWKVTKITKNINSWSNKVKLELIP